MPRAFFRRLFLPLPALLLALAAGAAAGRGLPRPTGPAEQARAFLEILEPAARRQARHPWADPSRRRWNFVPGPREGLSLAEQSPEARLALHALLRSVLSEAGYLKASAVMALEAVLRELEGSEQRDPERYWIAFYGEPGGGAPWALRFEGHHLSLNLTFRDGEAFPTPMFFGSNPARVLSGEQAGLQVLAGEEEAFRHFLEALTPDQRAAARAADEAWPEILMRPGVDALPPDRPLGLEVEDLDPGQFDRFLDLVAVFVDRLEPALAAQEWDRLLGVPDEAFRFRFVWAGSAEPGARHAWRIEGPDLILEYVAFQNGGNHVHTVWRGGLREFGGPAEDS